MNAHPDRLLNRLVVVALTVFIVASLLLTTLIFREIWLQQRIAGLSNGVETNLEDLEEVTEEIQSQLSDMRTTPGSAQSAEGGEDVAQLLENVDQQLESIEENLDEVLTVLEAEVELPTAGRSDGRNEPAELQVMQDRADQVFTIFAVLVGITAIAIALLLGMAVSVEDRASAGESTHQNRGVGGRASDVWRLVA